MDKKQLPYWLAFAHTPKVRTKKKNKIIASLREERKSISDFFSDSSNWNTKYDYLSQTDVEHFKSAYNLISPKLQTEVEQSKDASNKNSNYTFLVEDLLNQGYNILPIVSEHYSPILKKNLRYSSPPVIYTKGNLKILKEDSIAIVGSRKPNKVSLDFTDKVAKKASQDHKVVVSGFADGVDKKALDSALKHGGKSIIVLPQGIATLKKKLDQKENKKYYEDIENGDVLVLSTFRPRAPWSGQLAMARNSIIYGLASEIYVAESNEKGGTWSGVTDGLRKGRGRSIYVRVPNEGEKNANGILISKGAKAVDQNGEIVSDKNSTAPNSIASSPTPSGDEDKIIELLKQGKYGSQTTLDFAKKNK